LAKLYLSANRTRAGELLAAGLIGPALDGIAEGFEAVRENLTMAASPQGVLVRGNRRFS
jgi:hypothetical protein